jgi:predicted ribosomally synthesized peptide with nif11-like leader
MDERDFAAFREHVFADTSLQARLRRVVEREEFIALVVAAGRENGFRFTAEDVASAIVRGHTAWLMSGSPVLRESR